MEERRVERHVEQHEVEREEDVAPRRRQTNVNVAPDGSTNVQDVVEDVGGEPAEEVERRETIVERRTR